MSAISETKEFSGIFCDSGASSVRVEVWAHGDGYLMLDVDAWIADRATHDAELSEELSTAMESAGQRHPDPAYVSRWLFDKYGRDRVTGPSGDDVPWSVCLANQENLLSEDIGFSLADTPDGPLMIVQSGDGGLYLRHPEVYRVTADDLTDCLDYAHASAECSAGHRWHTDDTHHLHCDDASWDSSDVTDQARLADPDDRDSGYLACPTCGRPLQLWA